MASQRESDATTQEEGRISEESATVHHDIEQGGGLADGSGVHGEEDDGGPPLPLQQQFDERSDHEIKLAAAAALPFDGFQTARREAAHDLCSSKSLY